MITYFSARELLEPPTERAAFSDRQAYVCAELSKLAYFKFEGGHTLEQALGIVKGILGDDKRLALLEEQLRIVLSSEPSSAAEGIAALGKILQDVGFELAATFSTEGTQAFLCTRKVRLESGTAKTIAFLVFRGTEPKDFRDIKSDVKAALRKVEIDGDCIEIHSGYLDAFDLVRGEIEPTLKNTPYDQLFITGHSLGGALAMVTTRILASGITGACYTFGAPPIGTVDIQDKLKTPIYEIINEIDIVPRLPNPWMTTGMGFLFRLFRLVSKLFTVVDKLLASGTWDERLEVFIESMTRYRHPGYVSYLVGSGATARLRYNVSDFDRFQWWFSMMWKRRIWQFDKMVTDHSIDEYITKLRSNALNRR
jgi:pimeloyl-ACP methyl ester carboxylesterase